MRTGSPLKPGLAPGGAGPGPGSGPDPNSGPGSGPGSGSSSSSGSGAGGDFSGSGPGLPRTDLDDVVSSHPLDALAVQEVPASRSFDVLAVMEACSFRQEEEGRDAELPPILTDVCGTPEYFAPELVRLHQVQSKCRARTAST